MAANKEQLTMLQPRFIRLLNEMTANRELYSCKTIVNELMLCMEATAQMRLEALEGQARLAQRLNNRQWLRTLARNAEILQFHSAEWIDQHLYPLQRPDRPPSAMPTGPTRNARLGSDPTIERRVEDAARDVPMELSISAEEEERLLAPDSPPIREMDLDSCFKPDVSGCPSARRQVVGREIPSSSIVAGEIEQQECAKQSKRSPVRFPTPVPRQRSPRKPVKKSMPEIPKSARTTSPRQRLDRSPRRTSPRRRQSSPERQPRRTSPRRGQPSPARQPRRTSPRRRQPSPGRQPCRTSPRKRQPSPERKRAQPGRRPRSRSPRKTLPYKRPRSPSGQKSTKRIAFPVRRTVYQNPQGLLVRKVGHSPLMSETQGRSQEHISKRPERSETVCSGDASGTTGKVLTDKTIQCPVSRCPVSRCPHPISRMHSATHLPGIFDDQLEPTEELLRRRISALRIIESRLLGTVANLGRLVDFVNDLRQIRRGHYQISILQSKAMAEMCRLQGDEVPEEFSMVPVNPLVPKHRMHYKKTFIFHTATSFGKSN